MEGRLRLENPQHEICGDHGDAAPDQAGPFQPRRAANAGEVCASIEGENTLTASPPRAGHSAVSSAVPTGRRTSKGPYSAPGQRWVAT